MAHKNVSYYRGQYKDRLLPLLRELRATEEDSTNSFICVLKKMKEMRLMEKVVEETEEAFEERMEAIAEQWRDLHARRAQLKAHVVTSGTTVKFRDIEDVISYYKALVRTRKDLLQSQWWNRQLMEQSKVLQQQIRAEKEAEMLQCKNDLVQLKESFDQAQSDIRQWARILLLKQLCWDMSRIPQEDRWAEVQDSAARKATELKSLNMAIQSLFQAASTRLQPKDKVAAADSHRQLDMIQQFIYDLQDFTEDMKERSRPL
ncbi:coiled-coil domain containing 42 [Turdus rufiventris]|nr:coiled-coil domain containing 42 [Turdus rufiventris]